MARTDRVGRAAAAALLASALLGSSGIPAASAASTQTGAQTSTLAGAQTYLVVYSQSAVPSDAGARVAQAGGRLQYSYDAIGVVVATSNNATFRDNIKKDSRVDEAGQTALGVVRLKDRIGDDNNNGPSASSLRNKPATDTDSLSGLQWDMRQIHAPEAHQITGGNHSVLVADIDTGMDFKHADLKPNIDFENSASCIGGKPDQSPAAWNDDNGHGTHTAGTIAAASNGLGIVGVAPNVRIAAIKAGDSNGFFFPEAVVCAFMWAGTHDVNVTNNSYFADPFYYNCPSDPVEKAILTAESRAIRFAQNHGVAVVAAEGNFADDLAHPTVDIQSPDNATPVIRPVDRSCKIVPTTIPGVIVVSADGNLRQKSFYSSYGLGITDVTAPGGDSILQVTTDAVNGRVLSTFPPNSTLVQGNQCRASRTITLPSGDPAEPVAFYCYLQGTSMASPHVAGMAALILSRFGTPRGSDDENDDRTARLRALIDRAADPIACPSAAVLAGYAFFPQVDSLPLLVNGSGSAPQACTGGREFNSWYGHGEINLLKALSRGEGDN